MLIAQILADMLSVPQGKYFQRFLEVDHDIAISKYFTNNLGLPRILQERIVVSFFAIFL